MHLWTVALSLKDEARWQWGPTSLWVDIAFAVDPSILKFTHVRASDSLVAVLLGKTLIFGSPPGKWVDPKHYEEREIHGKPSMVYDRKQFIAALVKFNGNQKATAQYLGVNRKTVWRWIKKNNLGEEIKKWQKGCSSS